MSSVNLSVKFGQRVKELRKAAGISQEAFANKHGFARSYMPKIERGKANVALDAVQRLAEGLGVAPKALFESPGSQMPTRSKSSKPSINVPFAADRSCFNPSLRQPRAGTYVVGGNNSRQNFTDFDEALEYLKAMTVAKWWRPGPSGKLGMVTGVSWGTLPDEYR